MNLVLSSILAPIAGAAPVALGAYFLMGAFYEAEILFFVVTTGLPFAILLCLLGTSILQHEDLFQMSHSQYYCGFLGALIAFAATMGFLGFGLAFWGVIFWGFSSGILFRRLMGKNAA